MGRMKAKMDLRDSNPKVAKIALGTKLQENLRDGIVGRILSLTIAYVERNEEKESVAHLDCRL